VLAFESAQPGGDLIAAGESARLFQPPGPTSINRSRLSRIKSPVAGPAQDGVSTGPAIAILSRVKQEQAVRSTDLEWVGLAREERSGGGKTQQLFVAGPVTSFLLLGRPLREFPSIRSSFFDHRSLACWEAF